MWKSRVTVLLCRRERLILPRTKYCVFGRMMKQELKSNNHTTGRKDSQGELVLAGRGPTVWERIYQGVTQPLVLLAAGPQGGIVASVGTVSNAPQEYLPGVDKGSELRYAVDKVRQGSR